MVQLEYQNGHLSVMAAPAPAPAVGGRGAQPAPGIAPAMCSRDARLAAPRRTPSTHRARAPPSPSVRTHQILQPCKAHMLQNTPKVVPQSSSWAATELQNKSKWHGAVLWAATRLTTRYSTSNSRFPDYKTSAAQALSRRRVQALHGSAATPRTRRPHPLRPTPDALHTRPP